MFLKYPTAFGAILLVASQSVSAVTINFDYSYDGGFFTGANSGRQSILNAASNFFSSRLTDSLSAIASSGINRFDAVFEAPSTGSTITLTNYNIAADSLVVFVGGRSLSGNTLGEGGPGGYSASGTQGFFNTISQRGQAGPTTGNLATDFAPWGGQITFNSNSSWYFDANPSTNEAFSGNDFYSVALHEIGHLLGFGISDSWYNNVSGNSFIGTNSIVAYGGNVPLYPDLAHWKADIQSTVMGVSQEAAMDPTITTGTRKVFSKLDFAALEDVGWQVTTVPVPSAVWLFGSALIGLVGFTRKQAKA